MTLASLLALLAGLLLIGGGAAMTIIGATFAVFVRTVGVGEADHAPPAVRVVALAIALIGLLAFLLGAVLALRWLAWA